MTGGLAVFSDCGTYRYRLERKWAPELGVDPERNVLFVMLNPSVADAVVNDRTVTRCVRFAKSWGYASLTVCNLFALRSTDPRALHAHTDPVGPGNDEEIARCVRHADLIVAAWGPPGMFLYRDQTVMPLLGPLVYCLGMTKDGHPRHPLYLLKTTRPQPFGLYSRSRAAWIPKCPHGDLCSGCDVDGVCSRVAA